MLRFILKRRTQDMHSGLNDERLITLDADVPELESRLTNGGKGPSGFDITDLVGVEVLSAERAAAALGGLSS